MRKFLLLDAKRQQKSVVENTIQFNAFKRKNIYREEREREQKKMLHIVYRMRDPYYGSTNQVPSSFHTKEKKKITLFQSE
jgi:hypothetical protein